MNGKGSSGAFLRDCQIPEEPVNEYARDLVMAGYLGELSQELVGRVSRFKEGS